MRLPFLRPKPAPPAERARRAAGDAPVIEAARTLARRRLVGALVLLVIGVVGFPLLFETQPRPLPVDTPIELPRRDATAASAPMRSPQLPKPLPVTTLAADADNEGPAAPEAPPAASVAGPAASAQAAVTPAAAGVTVPAAAAMASAALPATHDSATAAASSAAGPGDGDRARVLLEGGASSPAGSRYVVQVGAFSDATKLREARAKVEKLGLKTYTQVIESDAGKRTRVRVGPYATREEADDAAVKIKRSGLPAAILTL